ncbi:MAG: DUF3786 domain-containing protein [Thermodesulfobacteriota bacterium]
MVQVRNPLEIYKLLPKTNCGRCYLPSCLAFAAAAVKGEKKLTDCPYLEQDEAEKFVGGVEMRDPDEMKRQQKVEALQESVAKLDLVEAAERLGGSLVNGSLMIRSLGKTFMVDRQGKVSSECHTHAGLTIPLLSYIVESKGGEPTGDWLPFRELRDGAPMSPLFTRKGEQGLQQLVDRHTDLLELLIDLFSGQRLLAGFSADISVVLYPLPKLPILICYWKAEEGMDSDLNIFFDSSASDHLGIRSIYALAVGLVMMFEKIARQHS